MLKENEVLYIKDKQMRDEVEKILEDNKCCIDRNGLYINEEDSSENYLSLPPFLEYMISFKFPDEIEITFEEFKKRFKN